jgi:hypothetical protein
LRAGGAISDTLGIESLASSIALASTAVEGIRAAAVVLKVSFDALSTTATALVGAISQLGGAKGLQQMMVEAVTNQQLINQTRFTVTGAERMTSADLNSLGNRLSEDILAGAFSKNEYLAGIKQIGTETGSQKSLSEDTLAFIGRFAKVGAMGFEEGASIFSRLKKQNMSLSDSQIEQMMLSAHAIGQAGSFNIQELPEASKLLQNQGLLGSKGAQAIQDLFISGTLLKAGGAADLEEAGTQQRAFLRQVELRGASGPFHLDVNKHLTNMSEAYSYIANTPASQMDKTLMTGRSGLFVSNIASAINQRAGTDATDFSPEAKGKRQAVIDDMEKMHMSMADLNKEFEESLTPADHFKVVFNKISDSLEAQFLPVLKRMQSVMDYLATIVKDKSKDMGDYFNKMVGWIMVLVTHLPELATVVKQLASAIGGLIVWALEAAGGNKEEAMRERDRLQKAVDNWDTTPHRKEDSLETAKKNLAKAKSIVGMYEADEALGRADPEKEAAGNISNLNQWDQLRLIDSNNRAAEQKLIDDQKANMMSGVTHAVPGTPGGIDTHAILNELQRHYAQRGAGNAHLEGIHGNTLPGAPSAPSTNSTGH